MIRAAGFTPRIIQNGHFKIKWVDQHGRSRCFIVPFSPSDWRAVLNSQATLRRLLRTP
jgi:hypothetical protein